MSPLRSLLFLLVFIFCGLLLNACSESHYLLQCAKGHLSLMSRARPIEEILAQDSEPVIVRDQLAKVVELREFAINTLYLPDTGSYRKYADLERPYAVWNLVVAPELSLDLSRWCFPIAGCVTYRGYFEEESARAEAKTFSDQGFDVDVYGVQAYSTLRWFDDPVLNTFLTNDEIRLAGLLFHEMSHQIVYVQNDTAFNESFAKTVEMEGLRRWLDKSGSPELWHECLEREERSARFNGLLGNVRDELGWIYASDLDAAEKRKAKKAILHKAFDDYADLKENWNGYEGFDFWMQGGLNNARLSSVAAYHDLVPAFQGLLKHVDGDMQKFYAEVKALSELPERQRLAKLRAFLPT